MGVHFGMVNRGGLSPAWTKLGAGRNEEVQFSRSAGVGGRHGAFLVHGLVRGRVRLCCVCAHVTVL